MKAEAAASAQPRRSPSRSPVFTAETGIEEYNRYIASGRKSQLKEAHKNLKMKCDSELNRLSGDYKERIKELSGKCKGSFSERAKNTLTKELQKILDSL